MTEQVKRVTTKGCPPWEQQSPLLWVGKALLRTVMAFVLAGYTPGGGIYPFGVAYLSTITGNLLFPVAAVGSLGYWVNSGGVASLKYIAAMMLVSMAKWFLFGEHTGKRWAVSLVSAVALGVPSLATALLGEASLYSVILSITEIALCFAGGYFFFGVEHYLEESSTPISKQDTISCLLFLCILVAALEGYHIFGISLGMVSAVVMVLMASSIWNEAGGAIVGTALAATTMLMPQSGNGVVPLFYAVGGLLAGIFRPMGKIASVLILLGAGTTFYMTNSGIDPLYGMLGIVLGGVIYLILPKEAQQILPLGKKETQEEEQALRILLKSRLERCGQALREMKETTQEVSFVTEKVNAQSTEGIYEAVANKLCSNCENNGVCWQKNYTSTIDILRHQIDDLKKNKGVDTNKFPEYFKERCPHSGELAQLLSEEYREYLRQLRAKREIARLRWVVTEQLEGVSKLLEGIAETVDTLESVDTQMEGRIRSYFQSNKMPPQRVFCYYDKEGRVHLEVVVSTTKLSRINQGEVTEDLSEILEVPLDLPEIRELDKSSILQYNQAAMYSVEYALRQHNAGQNKLCGDSCRMLKQENSKVYVVLSDGMGTGNAAAVESTMATNMLCDLLWGGADYESAVRLVNSALICKSSQESFATADIASVNLYTGEASFYKAAAAPTFLVKGGRVGRITACSLPIGMIKEITLEKTTTKLEQGDCIVQVSDGATATGEQWIIKELEQIYQEGVEEIATHLCDMAKERTQEVHEEDITVSVLRLC